MGLGLSTCDVNIRPKKIPVASDFLEFQDAWVEVGSYKRFDLSFTPFGSRQTHGKESEWKAIHLCLIPENPPNSISDHEIRFVEKEIKTSPSISDDSSHW